MSNAEIVREMGFIREALEQLLRRQGLKPITVRMEVAAWMIGFKLTKFKELLRDGTIDSFTQDRVRLVRVAELERWADAQSKPIALRFPKTRGKTEEEKIRAKMRR